jgi:hypothetical protein
MRSRILQSLAPIFLVIAFTPALCLAQAEINPDHFDSPSNISTVAKKATSNPKPSQAYASFVLPFDVSCAGVELTPGNYSLSIRQLGKRDVVRLMRTGNGVRAQVLELIATPRLNADGSSRLVVNHVNRRRTLTAISLREPGVTLFLQSGKENLAARNAEPVRIASSPSQALPVHGE